METNMSLERLVRPLLFVLTLAVALGAICAKSYAQEALFLVQYPHLNKNLDETGLDDEGKKKAESLARMLRDADIDVIYSFERPYVVQTAEPTAKALNMKVNILPFQIEAMDDLVRRLPTQHAKDRILVVTGPPSMSFILTHLGLEEEVWKALSNNLYVILPQEGEKPLVIKMRW
jgi:Histidine phosphatase superfamily (branch 1)